MIKVGQNYILRHVDGPEANDTYEEKLLTVIPSDDDLDRWNAARTEGFPEAYYVALPGTKERVGIAFEDELYES